MVRSVYAPFLIFASAKVFVFVATYAIGSTGAIYILQGINEGPIGSGTSTLFVTSIRGVRGIFQLAMAKYDNGMTYGLVSPTTIGQVFYGERGLGIDMTRVLGVEGGLVDGLTVTRGVTIFVLAPEAYICLMGVSERTLIQVLFFMVVPLFVVPLMTIGLMGAEYIIKADLTVGDVEVDFRPSLVPQDFSAVFVTNGLKGSLGGRLPSTTIQSFMRGIYIVIPIIGVASRQGKRYIQHPCSRGGTLATIPIRGI